MNFFAKSCRQIHAQIAPDLFVISSEFARDFLGNCARFRQNLRVISVRIVRDSGGNCA